MNYLVVSFSHKNTDIETRERLALSEEERREEVYKSLIELPFINELIIVSTCNRVEILASVKDPFKASEAILKKLSQVSGIELEELEGRADIYEDNGAIHHIFSVASALDSLVIGETQISGQLKSAFKDSFEKGYSSQKLARVMHFAFRCAAEVRNSTDISKNPVSIASAAVAQAKEIFEDLGETEAVVIGTGEMGVLAAKHLLNHGCSVTLIGRDFQKCEKISKELGPRVKAAKSDDIVEEINSKPLLFTATSSENPIITADMVQQTEFERYWFDMAVPRDIEEFEIDGLKVYVVDDLKEIVNKNLTLREAQAKEAYKIVGRYTREFFKWLQTLAIEPIIKGIREQAKDASLAEIKRAVKKGFIPPELEESVIKILHGAFNKFLHKPTKNIKAVANDPQGDVIVESIKYVFDLNGEEYNYLNRYKCEYYMNMVDEEEKGEDCEVQ